MAGELATVERFVVIGDGDTGSLPNAARYEELLAEQEAGCEYPDLDDRAAAGLCYTSGATGSPKGVLYSHRSQVIHSLIQLMAAGGGVLTEDRVLLVVPMFHANAWGLPYSSALIGSAAAAMPEEAEIGRCRARGCLRHLKT